MSMPRKLASNRLTTCDVDADGRTVRLSFLDETGAPVSVEFPFEQAEAIVMTLPRLLSNAIKTQLQSADARYVFPLGRWAVENADDADSLIVTLTTTDGFEASYGVPLEACCAIGSILSREGKAAIQDDEDTPKIFPLN